eukprot:1161174-Pelagomonas_calceolata.AAC.4
MGECACRSLEVMPGGTPPLCQISTSSNHHENGKSLRSQSIKAVTNTFSHTYTIARILSRAQGIPLLHHTPHSTGIKRSVEERGSVH